MIRTAEYVRKGHPDRVCDIISDAIVDTYLEQDPDSRVAVDTIGTEGAIVVFGEITSSAKISNTEIGLIAKRVYFEIGYKDNIGVAVKIHKQSPEINTKAIKGAGDSGIMIGYACRETPEMLPLEVVLAKKICDELDNMPELKPDGKVQVSIENEKIVDLVIAFQTKNELNSVKSTIERIIEKYLTPETKWHLIPFKLGGFEADSGLTGRKNVLWYGPRIPTGGDAFAGKDATKVDRSGAYFARWLAKNFIRKNKNFDSCTVEIAFVIGKEEPLMINMTGWSKDKGTRSIDYDLEAAPITVQGIIKQLDLKKPIYNEASLKGHFGNKTFSWEK